MRRPLPPELIQLGDQLEAAAARVLARRRTRRQLVMNAAASLVLAVPVTVALSSSQLTSTAPVSTVVPAPASARSVAPAPSRDVLPRDLRHLRLSPQSELLLLPSSLRPALR